MRLKSFILTMLTLTGLASCKFHDEVWEVVNQNVETGLRLISHTPASLTNLPINAAPIFTFSHTLDSSTIAGSITVSGGITGTSALNPNGRSITFTPAANFAYNTEYTFTIDSITDLNGEGLTAPILVTFKTTSDNVAPTFVNHTPLATEGISKTASFTFTFNEPLDPSTVSAATLTSTPTVPGSISLSADHRTITFNPDTDLADNTAYQFSLNGIADAVGNVMAPFTLDFTTTPDSTAPTFVSHTPASLSNLGTNWNVSFTFSEAIDPASVTFGSTFTVNNGATGALSFSADGRTITFDVAGYYARNTSYTFTIAGIKDLAGKMLATPASVTYTTIAGSPSITSSTPANGTSGHFMTDTLTVSFSEAMSATGASITISGPGGALRNIATVNLNADKKGFTVSFQPLPYDPGSDPGVSVTLTGFKALDGTPLSGNTRSWNMEKAWAQVYTDNNVYHSPPAHSFKLVSGNKLSLVYIDNATPTIRAISFNADGSTTPWTGTISDAAMNKDAGFTAEAFPQSGGIEDILMVAYSVSGNTEIAYLRPDGTSNIQDADNGSPAGTNWLKLYRDNAGRAYLVYRRNSDGNINTLRWDDITDLNLTATLFSAVNYTNMGAAIDPAHPRMVRTYQSTNYITECDPGMTWDPLSPLSVTPLKSLDMTWSRSDARFLLYAHDNSDELYFAYQDTVGTSKWIPLPASIPAEEYATLSHGNGDFILFQKPSQPELILRQLVPDGASWMWDEYKVPTTPSSSANVVASSTAIIHPVIAETPSALGDKGIFVAYYDNVASKIIVQRHRRK